MSTSSFFGLHEDHQPDRAVNLGRGEADAVVVLHRLAHVGDERLDVVAEDVAGGDRLSDTTEDGVA
jgi:hypothetical protein